MAQFEKHFTVDEANALLPELREILEEIRARRDRLAVHWEQAVPVIQASAQNGGGKEGHPLLSTLQRLNDRLRAIAELGVQLKDVDRGLVDFPAWREDREVFLCWHLGEAGVTTWHEIEAGYAGRQPL